MTPTEREPFDDAARLLEESLIARVATGAARVLRTSVQSSRTLAAGRALLGRCEAVPYAGRIRMVGLALIAFGGTYFALMLIVPSRAAPLYPAIVSGLAGIAGTLCMLAPDAFANALRARRRRRAQNGDA